MSYIERQDREQRGLFVVPVLVTAAPLFFCDLDEDNSARLEERQAIDVWGYAVNGRRVRVYVMQESHLMDFATDLHDRASQAGQ